MKKKVNKKETRAALRPEIADGPDFTINPYYERLLEMKSEKPEIFNVLSGATRLAVEAYVKAKQTSAQTALRKAAA